MGAIRPLLLMIESPNRAALENINDVEINDFPRFAPAQHDREHPQVEDLESATVTALANLDFETLDPGAEIAITAGSRGIHDNPVVLQATVSKLQERGFEPFIFPAMGSHGGATAEGQVEMLASLGITEGSMGCEIRSSMAVEEIGKGPDDRPIYASSDAIAADAILVVNRVKAHTDFTGPIESGLCKMTVIGMGKQRGAEATHNAALARGHKEVIPERAEILFKSTPVLGGIAIIENADDRAAHIEGIPVDKILDCEPQLLARSKELLPTLPVNDLDLLIVDTLGKDISGTGMDTNVLGRMLMHGQPEPDKLDYTRIHVRSLTEGSHGNSIGIGLADYAHQNLIETTDLTDTYLNAVTGGAPERARLPLVMPTDTTAFLLAYSTTGVRYPSEMRIIRIPNTLDLGRFIASEPVANDLRNQQNVTLGEFESLAFEDGDLLPASYTDL